MKNLFYQFGIFLTCLAGSSQLWAPPIPTIDEVEEGEHPAVWRVIEKDDRHIPPGSYKSRGSAVPYHHEEGRLFALSAAHCYADENVWKEGDFWFLTKYAGGKGQEIAIKCVVCHPGYDAKSHFARADLAVLELEVPSFDVDIASLRLAAMSGTIRAKVYGYGLIEYPAIWGNDPIQNQTCTVATETVMPSSWFIRMIDIDPLTRRLYSMQGKDNGELLLGCCNHKLVLDGAGIKIVPSDGDHRHSLGTFGGMSGGGLLDQDGHLIGICSHSVPTRLSLTEGFLDTLVGLYSDRVTNKGPDFPSQLDAFVNLSHFYEWIQAQIKDP